uniref:PI3K/PI4K catalytic domain-containing protein n=1 Tax=Pseudo-nitzschia australis TaxID=44445 RepID=A0A7S4ATB5_9STRA|mmetsp:Transcript_17188/g.37604  ORF Transcript_17188/g.37604 Transcript_17188/m.37604 type:complete len:1013 (+) Transcript_17188:198-3236(+)
MFDVTNFLMRWLFLSNLVRNIAEIQTLPYNPSIPQSSHVTPVNYDGQTINGNYEHMAHSDQSSLPSLSTATNVKCEDVWRDQCLRGILSYPPGSQRLLIMDAMRAELVERLSWSLKEADQTLDNHERSRCRRETEIYRQEEEGSALYKKLKASSPPKKDSQNDCNGKEEKTVLGPDIDPNVRIKVAEKYDKKSVSLGSTPELTLGDEGEETRSDLTIGDLYDGGNEREEDKIPEPSADEVNDARNTIRVVRDFLPQLVSVVLKSPPAFDPRLVNPVEKLRSLIVRRCVDDANWGVDMCWLLEAEVGRAWKSLFEHRQQTGRRLIIVLPADKAAVLATIGSGKREAFDLLQDAEQATAFGYTIPFEDNMFYRDPHHLHQQQQHYYGQDVPVPPSKKLPSSLSLRRCSHFGDTMHFIDRLTKISLDMRNVPIVHRKDFLHNSLREMNRRLRRRMVTRGDVSIDVEDHRSPDDWPLTSDVTSDMLMYSVHLPLDPKQNKLWPGDASTPSDSNEGAVRILNIVVEEAIVLSSRERCPYLIRVEVADTNLRGKDSRLYASGAPGLGATMEEALTMNARPTSRAAPIGGNQQDHGFGNYHIPSELLAPTSDNLKKPQRVATTNKDLLTDIAPKEMPRGGWQANETVFYSHNPEDVYTINPYDTVRENEFEELHHQMYEDGMVAQSPPSTEQRGPIVSTRGALLDRIFGQPLTENCEEIRQASPYGKVEGWRLASFIMKAGEDIRREALVMQIISKLNDWFKTDIPEPYRPYMRPYTIMCVGGDAGIVECLADAKSVDEVKKGTDGFESLRDYFERAYGPPGTYSNPYQQEPGATRMLSFDEAQDNFLRSLVGYSVICYILQIKDRHNANIMMDREGNIIHIDFGFVLGDTPKMCKVPIFSEKAPFKLSDEYWEVLGGWNTNQGGLGVRFCHMFEHAFACASAHSDEIAALVEATMLTMTQNYRQARTLANGVRKRLKMRGPPGSNEQKAFIMELVNAARTSMGTATYDWLQRNMNGYQ